jgi:4-hydroxybenzoate polyprenyltransferase
VSEERGPPGLAARLARYQAERFPLVSLGPLLALFAFSSAAYSHVARGATAPIPWPILVVGMFTAITFFFVLRVLDEHKDREVDARYRPELPVPRGLVTLGELRATAIAAVGVAFVLNALVAPVLLLPWLAIAAWMFLMTIEFFVRDWLRAHAAAYLLTHMAIMPLIDLYTTGLDWLAAGAPAPRGIPWFLAVTFANGVLIEVGRKVRAPADEREGVDTYTKAWGIARAPAAWLLTLAASVAFACVASRAEGTGAWACVALVVLGAACAWPAVAFLRSPERGRARAVDRASGLWPMATYLLLGSLPYLTRVFGAGSPAGAP